MDDVAFVPGPPLGPPPTPPSEPFDFSAWVDSILFAPDLDEAFAPLQSPQPASSVESLATNLESDEDDDPLPVEQARMDRIFGW